MAKYMRKRLSAIHYGAMTPLQKFLRKWEEDCFTNRKGDIRYHFNSEGECQTFLDTMKKEVGDVRVEVYSDKHSWRVEIFPTDDTRKLY